MANKTHHSTDVQGAQMSKNSNSVSGFNGRVDRGTVIMAGMRISSPIEKDPAYGYVAKRSLNQRLLEAEKLMVDDD